MKKMCFLRGKTLTYLYEKNAHLVLLESTGGVKNCRNVSSTRRVLTTSPGLGVNDDSGVIDKGEGVSSARHRQGGQRVNEEELAWYCACIASVRVVKGNK